jgi:cholesterol transport system auxiliary component
MKRGAILMGVCLASLSSCALLSPVKIDAHKEVLSRIPVDLPQARTTPASLLVLAPDANPVYDTTEMAYAIEPFQVAYFSRSEWGETPAQMIQPLIVRTLQKSHRFSAVLSPPYMGRYTYALRSRIVELKQDFTSEPAALQLSLRFELTRWAANEAFASIDISLREPMLEKNPNAGVVAANNAMAEALRQLARFVVEKTGEPPAPRERPRAASAARYRPST